MADPAVLRDLKNIDCAVSLVEAQPRGPSSDDVPCRDDVEVAPSKEAQEVVVRVQVHEERGGAPAGPGERVGLRPVEVDAGFENEVRDARHDWLQILVRMALVRAPFLP